MAVISSVINEPLELICEAFNNDGDSNTNFMPEKVMPVI